ncbi:hypothetical protein EKO04_008946 [Ascochyta lentis]|uniref:Polyketide synthase n=1 Tax=Ascochyta lentis TaxID=205686 RepID=A0A8H7IZ31_9PLEO|nr:hypothetical protein EKO04_008946 [Ascochyta lentis]
MTAKRTNHPHEAIAIIGSGFRFPGGANTPSKLWDLLREPHDVQSSIPESRFSPDGFFHPANDHHGMSNVRNGYFLQEDIRQFDSQFFGIKPVEASSMDPQQRYLLEVTYECIEAAGLSIEELRGSSTAVYVGLMAVDYTDLLNRDTSSFPPYVAAGTARSMLANRVSYFFDWKGPSMTIDTACSSSLVAVHQAVQSLRSGEAHVAVAAGANLLLGPEQFIAGSNMNMLSPDGRSYMWDSRANGYARGEGVAAIVLKTLSAAIADCDDIECLIVETGLNQDGKTKGLTVPSATAQAALIQATYRKAGLDLTKNSDRPQYFEAHGTGTPAGDPLEAEAIQRAFFGNSELGHVTHPLHLGSIKTIIGHTEGAAGLAGMIRASLALKNGVIPPNLLFENLAPAVKPFFGNLEIATKAKSWPALEQGCSRRASVNSFGFGGTNAHCIMESYSPSWSVVEKKSQVYTPFLFSAASEKALLSMVASYSTHLKSDPSIDFRALSHTLCNRRSALPFRVAFSARSVETLCAKLDTFIESINKELLIAAPTSPSPIRILGIFTGQGAQWAGMACKLMASPLATKIVGELEWSLSQLSDPPQWSLKSELSADRSSSRIMEAAIAQPACTALQILLVELLRTAGVSFSTVVGHSSGEIAAAYAAGYLSAQDAIRIAYYRGVHLHLVQGRNGEAGAMMAVGTSYEEAQMICDSEELRGKICVAASNSASSVTLSGDVAAIESVKAILQGRNKFVRLLRVDNAYHSHHMIACSEAITTSLRACGIQSRRPNHPACTWVSSVYQQDISSVKDDLNDVYWHSNTVGPVLFSQALEYALAQSRFELAIEVGAHPALKGPASQVIECNIGHIIPYTGLLSRDMDDVEAFSSGLGYIWASFSSNVVDFANYDRSSNNSELPRMLKGLPGYPWEHQRAFWHESRVSKTFRHRRTHHELLGASNPNYSEDHVSWTNRLIPKELPWISGHRIQGHIIFPGAGYMSSAFEAAREIADDQPMKLIELISFSFGQPLIFDTEDSRVEILISLTHIQRRNSSLSAEFNYYSVVDRESGPMILNASCQLFVTLGEQDAHLLHAVPEPTFGMTGVNAEQFYDSLAGYGYDYTGPFRALTCIERKLGAATGLIQVSYADLGKRLLIHPAALDAALHSIIAAYCYPGDGSLVTIPLPTDVSRIAINPVQALESSCTQYLRFLSYSRDNKRQAEGDVDVYPANGSEAVIQLEGLHTKPMIPATPQTDVQIFSETIWGPAAPVIEHSQTNYDASKLEASEYSSVLAGFTKQLSHRYPAMNIVEIHAGAGSVTNCILKGLDGSFNSYTYTDSHANDLHQAREKFKAHKTRLTYKTLNINEDVLSQGHTKHYFDLVIASLALNMPSKLPELLENIRRLLKPGGYLLLQRIAPEMLVEPGCSPASIAAQMLPHRAGSYSLSHLDISEWNSILQDNGFLGVNSTPTLANSQPLAQYVVAAQATDDRINFLHRPLATTKEKLNLSKMTIVGGATVATAKCVSNLTHILDGFGSVAVQIPSFELLPSIDLPFGGTVVTLQDHDRPVFDHLDEKKLQGMQRVFEKSKNVLWVTHGYKHNSPLARMTVAFARCLLQEMPHIRFQLLDLPSPEALDATLISEHLLRMLATETWEDQGRLEDILWSFEPEVCHENGHDYIPRVKPSKVLNDRYNSAHRQITNFVDPKVTPVTISSRSPNRMIASKYGIGSTQDRRSGEDITICVTQSLLEAVKIETYGYCYLILGIDSATDKQVIALSSTLSSVVDVRRDLVQICPVPKCEAVRYLIALFYGLIATQMLRNLARGDSLVVLEPEKDLAAIIEALATPRGIKVMFFTTGKPSHGQETWRSVHARASRRATDAALPQQLSRLICWESNHWTLKIKENIPGDVQIETIESYVAAQASCLQTTTTSRTSHIFDDVRRQLLPLTSKIEAAKVQTVSLSKIHNLPLKSSSATLIDWMTEPKVPLTVEPIDSRPLFRVDRTYWLVGLTGTLGLSLCQWMISRGARYIVISSRNPKVDPRWFNHFKSLNATVKVYANDVTNRTSVASLYNEIKTVFPPIAGVCHGAMVLQDALVRDLDIPRVKKVLGPKVEGAIHLDEVFRHHDLDFFIMLSSIAAVTGNPGQAIYAAANGFLAGLAVERRARGMSASTVNLGAIVGNGYLTRELTLTQQAVLQKAGVMWTSEQDFHQAFAEAVIASPLLSGCSAEFCTGVRVFCTDEANQPRHAKSPIFSHLMRNKNDSERFAGRKQAAAPVKVRLLQATTTEDVSNILAEFLTLRLKLALQMPHDADVIDQTADALGIDSLIAVEMRSWFLKELSIDMPVLKIIGGGTMRDVLGKAQELYHLSMAATLIRRPGSNESAVLNASQAKTEATTPSVRSFVPETTVVSHPTVWSPCIQPDHPPKIVPTSTDLPDWEVEGNCATLIKENEIRPHVLSTATDLKASGSKKIITKGDDLFTDHVIIEKTSCHDSSSDEVHTSQKPFQTPAVAATSFSSKEIGKKTSVSHIGLVHRVFRSRRLQRLLRRF